MAEIYVEDCLAGQHCEKNGRMGTVCTGHRTSDAKGKAIDWVLQSPGSDDRGRKFRIAWNDVPCV